jgi:hypothetical protein
MNPITPPRIKSAHLVPHRPEAASGSGNSFLTERSGGGTAMLSFDSYREVLSEHARGHHAVGSAWFVVVAIIVFLVVSA